MKVSAQCDGDGLFHFTCPGPQCRKRLRTRKIPKGLISCPNPGCGMTFEVRLAEPTGAVMPPTPAALRQGVRSTAPAPPLPSLTDDSSRSRKRKTSPMILWGIATATFLVVVGGSVGGGLLLFNRSPRNSANAIGGDTTPLADAKDSRPVEVVSTNPAPVPPLPKEENKTPPAQNPPPRGTPKEKDPPKPSPKFAPTTLRGRDLHAALVGGLKLSGTLTPENVTEGFYPRTEHSYRWIADVRLANSTTFPIDLGGDLHLIEVSTTGISFEGFAVFNRKSAVLGPASYGLDRNYENEGMRINIAPGTIRASYGLKPAETFGDVRADKPWILQRDFPQWTWLRDDQRKAAWLVLPEVRVATTGGPARFRLVVAFGKPLSGKGWGVREHQLWSLENEDLKNRLKDNASDLVTKVLAANWLAENHPKEAPVAIVEAARSLRDGQLLGSCLVLLTNLKAPGLETHAIDLLGDNRVPNGIRASSARYVGAAHHEPGLKRLIAATEDKDTHVAGAAIEALGLYNGPQAIEALAKILRDARRGKDHPQAAGSLAQTKDASAIEVLKDAATKNESALQALATAGLPETFDFFVKLAATVKQPGRRDTIARGLKASGGDKALPMLLQMVESNGPGSERDSYDGLVGTLVEMNSPAATTKLVELAGAGNYRAVYILARSKNDSVRTPLTELASKVKGPLLSAVLNGLVENWAKQSGEVFASALDNPDAQVVQAAVRGLEKSKHPKAAVLLIPLLEHKAQGVRSTVSWTLEQLVGAEQAAKLAEVLLRSADGNVVSACSRMLIKAKWKDRTAIPKLGEKLRAAQEFQRRDIVFLLRHLSDDAMGPANDNEWYKDAKGWHAKWLEWAAKQK